MDFCQEDHDDLIRIKSKIDDDFPQMKKEIDELMIWHQQVVGRQYFLAALWGLIGGIVGAMVSGFTVAIVMRSFIHV